MYFFVVNTIDNIKENGWPPTPFHFVIPTPQYLTLFEISHTLNTINKDQLKIKQLDAIK